MAQPNHPDLSKILKTFQHVNPTAGSTVVTPPTTLSEQLAQAGLTSAKPPAPAATTTTVPVTSTPPHTPEVKYTPRPSWTKSVIGIAILIGVTALLLAGVALAIAIVRPNQVQQNVKGITPLNGMGDPPSSLGSPGEYYNDFSTGSQWYYFGPISSFGTTQTEAYGWQKWNAGSVLGGDAVGTTEDMRIITVGNVSVSQIESVVTNIQNFTLPDSTMINQVAAFGSTDGKTLITTSVLFAPDGAVSGVFTLDANGNGSYVAVNGVPRGDLFAPTATVPLPGNIPVFSATAKQLEASTVLITASGAIQNATGLSVGGTVSVIGDILLNNQSIAGILANGSVYGPPGGSQDRNFAVYSGTHGTQLAAGPGFLSLAGDAYGWNSLSVTTYLAINGLFVPSSQSTSSVANAMTFFSDTAAKIISSGTATLSPTGDMQVSSLLVNNLPAVTPTTLSTTARAVPVWSTNSGNLLADSSMLISSNGTVTGVSYLYVTSEIYLGTVALSSLEMNKTVSGPTVATPNAIATYADPTGRILLNTNSQLTAGGDLTVNSVNVAGAASISAAGVGQFPSVLINNLKAITSTALTSTQRAVPVWSTSNADLLTDSLLLISPNGTATGLSTLYVTTEIYIGTYALSSLELNQTVSGPGSATPNAIPAFADSTGRVLLNTATQLTAGGALTINSLNVNGAGSVSAAGAAVFTSVTIGGLTAITSNSLTSTPRAVPVWNNGVASQVVDSPMLISSNGTSTGLSVLYVSSEIYLGTVALSSLEMNRTVSGPGVATANAIPTYADTTGRILLNTNTQLTTAGDLTVQTLTIAGNGLTLSNALTFINFTANDAIIRSSTGYLKLQNSTGASYGYLYSDGSGGMYLQAPAATTSQFQATTGGGFNFNNFAQDVKFLVPSTGCPTMRFTDNNLSNIRFQTLVGGNSGYMTINWNGYFCGTELRDNTAKRRIRMGADQRPNNNNWFIDSFDGTTIRAHIFLDFNTADYVQFPFGILTNSITTSGTADLLLNPAGSNINFNNKNLINGGTITGTVLTASTSLTVRSGANNAGTVLQLGSISTGVSSATPNALDMGSGFSSTAGSNPKLKIFSDSSNNLYGIGASASQMDYMVSGTSAHVFYTNGTERLRITPSQLQLAVPIATGSGDLSLNPAGSNVNFNSKNLINVVSIAGPSSTAVSFPNGLTATTATVNGFSAITSNSLTSTARAVPVWSNTAASQLVDSPMLISSNGTSTGLTVLYVASEIYLGSVALSSLEMNRTVSGPGVATANAIPVFSDSTGRILLNTNTQLTTGGALTINSLSVNGAASVSSGGAATFASVTIGTFAAITSNSLSSTARAVPVWNNALATQVVDSPMLISSNGTSTGLSVLYVSSEIYLGSVALSSLELNRTVSGPAVATANAIPVFSDSTGRILLNTNTQLTTGGALTINSLSVNSAASVSSGGAATFASVTIGTFAAITSNSLGSTARAVPVWNNALATQVVDSPMLISSNGTSTGLTVLYVSSEIYLGSVALSSLELNRTVSGPAVATANAIPVFSDSTGRILLNTNTQLTTGGALTVNSLSVNGAATVSSAGAAVFTSVTIGTFSAITSNSLTSTARAVPVWNTASANQVVDSPMLISSNGTSTGLTVLYVSSEIYLGTVALSSLELNRTVSGPATATANAIPVFSDSTGRILLNTNTQLTTAGDLTINSLNVNGAASVSSAGAAVFTTISGSTITASTAVNVQTSANNAGTVIQLGTVSVAVSSTTPNAIDLGCGISSAAGANPKFRVYSDSGGAMWGLGVSSSQLDYITTGGVAAHVFYANGAERFRISPTAITTTLPVTVNSLNVNSAASISSAGAAVFTTATINGNGLTLSNAQTFINFTASDAIIRSSTSYLKLQNSTGFNYGYLYSDNNGGMYLQAPAATTSQFQLTAAGGFTFNNFAADVLYLVPAAGCPTMRFTDGVNTNIRIQTLTGANSGYMTINFNGYYCGAEKIDVGFKWRTRIGMDARGTGAGSANQFFIDSWDGATPRQHILIDYNTANYVQFPYGILTNSITTSASTDLSLNPAGSNINCNSKALTSVASIGGASSAAVSFTNGLSTTVAGYKLKNHGLAASAPGLSDTVTSEQAFVLSALDGSTSVPANTLTLGSLIMLDASLSITNTGNTGTIHLLFYLGTTVIADCSWTMQTGTYIGRLETTAYVTATSTSGQTNGYSRIHLNSGLINLYKTVSASTLNTASSQTVKMAVNYLSATSTATITLDNISVIIV